MKKVEDGEITKLSIELLSFLAKEDRFIVAIGALSACFQEIVELTFKECKSEENKNTLISATFEILDLIKNHINDEIFIKNETIQ